MNRETVPCPHCVADPGEPCVFPEGEPWTVVEDGIERRTVHAGRYALTLAPEDRRAFWSTALDKYLSDELAALDGKP